MLGLYTITPYFLWVLGVACEDRSRGVSVNVLSQHLGKSEIGGEKQRV